MHEKRDLHDLRQLHRASQNVPSLFYGKVLDKQLAFQLSGAGVNYFVQGGNSAGLVEKLRELQAQATFRIDIRDFGIDLEQSGYWTRKFFQNIIKEHRFLNSSVVKVAAVDRDFFLEKSFKVDSGIGGTVIIDEDGSVKFAHRNLVSNDLLRQLITKLSHGTQ